MQIIKKAKNKLIISNFKYVLNHRKSSVYFLIINLIIIATFFAVLPIFTNYVMKIIFVICILLFAIPGILLIRFQNSTADSFIINKYQDKFTHKHINILAKKTYIASYPIKNIVFIHIQRISVNSEDNKDYQVTLCLKNNKKLIIGYFSSPETAFKVAKTISKFLKIPLKKAR